MADARARGWGWPGAPGSADDREYRRRYIVTVSVAGIRLAVRREVAHLFVGFCEALKSLGYRLDVNQDDWGYANRDIRGRPGVKSNHAWGLAIDLNARDNPMTSDGRVHTNLPPGVDKLAARYGLFWGGNYRGTRKDPMHFEFLGTPADVDRYPLHQPGRSDVMAGRFPNDPRFVKNPSGPGGWLIAEDGGVANVGGASMHGSMGGQRLNAPIKGLVPTPDGGGYVLIGADGGTFNFGNAPQYPPYRPLADEYARGERAAIGGSMTPDLKTLVVVSDRGEFYALNRK